MLKKSVIAASVVALLSTGCASNGEMSNQQKGAIIGAVAGAVLGKSTSNHKDKRAVIGAVLGGIAGATVGDYMDKQEQELKKEVAGTGVEVSRNGDEITLSFPDKITFALNSSAIKPQLHTVLDDVANVMSKYDQTLIMIEGHTDSSGSEQYNQQLSEKRALSVYSYFEQQGLDSRRMIPSGFGEMRPIASNETAAGRAENRRVEIRMEPVVKS